MKKLLLFSIIGILVASTLFGFILTVATKFALLDLFLTMAPTDKIMPKTNILLVGVDNAFGHRTDTIMVLHTDPQNKVISLISIPRDTLALLPDRGLDKINHAYAYGRIELTRKTVANLLKIELPYYIIINLSGITNVIDSLGGITLNVEKRMYYIDHAGGLDINLQPGWQRLNGKEAMGYLRYRRDGGDFSRINRQQNFLRSLGDELIKKENILRSPKLFFSLLSNIETNLSSRQALGLALATRTAHELGNVKMATLPGTDMNIDGIYYWKIDEERLRTIVNSLVNGQGVLPAEENY